MRPALRLSRWVSQKRGDGDVDDALVVQPCAELGNAGLIDLVVTIGCYQLLRSFCGLPRIKVDEGVAHVPFND